MASRNDILIEITPQVLLQAYSAGIFPMAESADDPALYWIEPESRGILPLDAVHVPRRLARTIRAQGFDIRINSDFDAVIAGCAATSSERQSTWINARIRQLYGALFRQGHCHTVETWFQGRLVGGLYGVSLGSAFFGESMFSTERDASKVALIYLVARLIHGRYTLLDTQFVTDHLRQFGTVDLGKRAFHRALKLAVEGQGDFLALPTTTPPNAILDVIKKAAKPASGGALS